MREYHRDMAPGGRTRAVERTSRRGFLKGVAAAVVAPYAITSSALGGGGWPAASERTALGFIGLGLKGGPSGHGAGNLLAEFAGNPACQVLALCDVDRRHLARSQDFMRKRHGNKDCAACGDFRELVSRQDIDAVVIATPDHWHAVQTVWACRRGKDVYCEKPLSLTVREARATVAAARRYGCVVQVGSQSRSLPSLRFGCEVVRSGRIGKVLEVHVGCGGTSRDVHMPAQPVPQWLDWDLWLGPAPWQPYNAAYHPVRWRGFRDFSGGDVTDWGAHRFDLAQWALGMDDSGPVEVFPPGANGHQGVSYRYASGTMLFHDQGASLVSFKGTDGTVVLDAVSGSARYDPPDIGRRPIAPDEVKLTYQAGNKCHTEDFLDAVRTRRKPNADVETGCRSVTVCHLGNIAYWLRRPLKWDPQKEQFIGDEEANRHFWRPMREPWRL